MTSGNITKSELARRLNMAERHVYTVLKGKTASRDLAERIAKHYGGEPEDYLRPPRRRGRTRPHPFRAFIKEKAMEDELAAWKDEQRDDCGWLAYQLAEMYDGHVAPMPPVDFLTLEALANFIANAGNIPIEQRDNSTRLWKLFRVWREEQLHRERVFDIECEESDDFG